LLFGPVWSRPDEVTKETNSSLLAFIFYFSIDLSQNRKKPVFVVVYNPFSYVHEFFHDFRIFPQTMVNISKHIPNSHHYCLHWEQRQIDTNMIFGHMMNLHQVYVG
jgi:hypothetical protein